jgi:predicted Zn-ribbon and HTH transcriptional regulator
MPKVKLDGYRCERCEWEWLPRDKTKDPKVCPKCKSPYWDTPRRNTPGVSESKKKKAK